MKSPSGNFLIVLYILVVGTQKFVFFCVWCVCVFENIILFPFVVVVKIKKKETKFFSSCITKGHMIKRVGWGGGMGYLVGGGEEIG